MKSEISTYKMGLGRTKLEKKNTELSELEKEAQIIAERQNSINNIKNIN